MKKIIFTILTFTTVMVTVVFVFVHSHSSELGSKEAIFFNTTSQITSSTSIGLIVPHFAPVSNLIVEALDYVTTTPDLIILIGPNHHESGKSPITTGSYISSQLSVHPLFATEKMHTLAQMHIAAYDDGVISGDHSIGTPLPFIVQKFPRTPVLVLMLKYHQNPDDIEHLVASLHTLSSTRTLIIASLDFSHYLSSDRTPEKDADTERYIVQHDYRHIENLSNDYIDSPWSLITFLKYLEAFDVHQGTQIAHTNTGVLAAKTIESSTSFFTYIFEK